MKKILSYTALSICLLGHVIGQSLTAADRDKAVAQFKQTKKELLKTVKGLSDEQLNYKPDETTWSVAECLEHLTISEQTLFGIVQMTLQSEPDPTGREDVRMSDEEVLGLIKDRSSKVKTRPDLEPTNQFGSVEGTLNAFKERRDTNIEFVKTTDEDLRNRYFEFPFGKVDAVQVLLFISGHSQRHIDQMKELIAMQSFPG